MISVICLNILASLLIEVDVAELLDVDDADDWSWLASCFSV